MAKRKPLTTHVGKDYVAILRKGQTTDEAICTIKYPSKATIALAKKMAAAEELLEMLKSARDCIAYCRRAHKDAQSGSGMPIEILIDAVIAKAEAR